VSRFPGTALVTGGASGIGAALVALLAREGAEVRSLDLADGFDVSDPRAWGEVDPVEAAFLNAGVGAGESDPVSVSDCAYRRIVGTNVDGVVLGVRRLAAAMAPGSAIVASASLAGLTAMPEDPLYTLTKHAVVGYVRSVAPHLDARGIRINAIAPGFADTPLVDAPTRERLAGQGVLLLDPDEVAAAALRAARSDGTGEVWWIQPGREPEPFRFPRLPGPRPPEP
jgi:NAD(P)-dependent dehydrogenase (short-subunit alcohol dehydrogenase family)